MRIQVAADADTTAFFGCDSDGVTVGGTTGARLAGSYTSPPPYNDDHSSPVDLVKLLPVVLGKGAFGRVYVGMYRGQRVAVKQVLDLHDDSGSQDSFAQELEVLGRCRHPNIVRVLAACLAPPRPCLVMELMDTSLDKLLYSKPEPLPMELVLCIAIQVACGLEYLHPTNLKPANVLVNAPWGERPVVKLSDFGLSRLRSTALVTNSPEAGTVLLWEMLAGKRPWEGLGIAPIACQVTFMGRRLPVPPTGVLCSQMSRWPLQLCQLVDECWDSDPERRPAAAELAKRLMLVQQKLKETGDPPQNMVFL
ncbi:putative serine/threonine-protein kinase [Tetrabaena socialis]|uniref:Putative serine/threonine-protein kinase n=1 Tax=Tetrabaena socialis TaxID=47790 RepID=A0A2J8AGJ1_9CHLO|nr:putative serine/threonine-protein kinase [Tetrabaena socialis]|eukprot:PNH11634.1 putative serine/threonine-protein kinase [Tetrabaena socialis]